MNKELRSFCLAALALAVLVPCVRGEEPAQRFPNGTIVRAESGDLRVEDMTDAELQQRLAEYEAGKRDDRDGYIILNQLWFNHQVKRTTESSDFQAVTKKRNDLLKKHPEFNGLKDFQLSDRIKYRQRQQAETEKIAGKQSKWKPWDNVLLRLYVHNDRALARYQYQLVFLKIPTGAQIGRDPWNNKEVLTKDGKTLNPLDLPDKKIQTFKDHVSVLATEDNSRFLVCTAPSKTHYIAMDEAEIRLLGETRVPWKNDRGEHADFCGIVSIAGETIYQFPFSQRRPKDLLSPLSISPDGSYAAVMIGQEVEGEDDKSVSKPREVWTWEYPNKLSKHPGPWKSGEPSDGVKAFEEMRKKFRRKPQ